MKNGISLLMIARNEERVIALSLNSFSRFVDEMIVADTGSEDDTVRVAKACGARCVSIPWEDDFSKARNRLIQLASYKWILFADADETLKEETAHRLRSVTELEGTAACLVRFEDCTDEGNFRTYYLPRLFLNNDEIRYENCVHETLTASLDRLLETKGMGAEKTGITFIHTGYLKSALAEKETLKRNLSLLEKGSRETPRDVFILLKYGDNLRLLGRDREALNALYNAFYLEKERGKSTLLLPEICSSLTTMLIKSGNLDEASNILNGQPETERDVSMLYNLGLLNWKKGDFSGALDRYMSAEKLLLNGRDDPHGLFPFILNGIGEILLTLKIPDRSESYFKRSHAYAGRLLLPVFNLVRLSLENNDLETARYYIKECERIAPDHITVTEAKRAIYSNAPEKTDSAC